MSLMKSIRDFGVLPTRSAAANKMSLQRAIDWASARGAALFVDPDPEPYPVAGGLVLRRNASLVGVHGPVGRGTRHPEKQQPVGSVFQIEYDIPRILHCHVNPANQRFIRGGYSKAVIDATVRRRTFCYTINHTDNAQLMDLFTFGTWGGIYLGPATYGQLTNFNLDCVAVGIHKLGDSTFNRNWQIAQGSIIANTGDSLEDIHPFIVEGQGHTSLSNVEAFSGGNPALTCVGKSQDFILVRGDKRLTINKGTCPVMAFGQ